MKSKLPLVLVLTVAASGCSILGNDKEPTIASLGKRPVQLEDKPVVASESEAISAYRAFLASADDTDERPQAMRRIADLNLEKDVMPEAGATTLQLPEAHESIELYQNVLTLYPER